MIRRIADKIIDSTYIKRKIYAGNIGIKVIRSYEIIKKPTILVIALFILLHSTLISYMVLEQNLMTIAKYSIKY